MFRDESTKVIRKAHAQWGLVTPSNLGETAAATEKEPAEMRTTSGSVGAKVSRSQPGSTSPGYTVPVHRQRPASASPSGSQITGHRVVQSPLTPNTARKAPSSTLLLSDSSANIRAGQDMSKPSLSLVPMGPTMEEQGIHFYVNRYLVGLPDEPKSTSDLTASHWIWNPALQHVVAAIGLAGLSNLTGNASEYSSAS